MLGEITVSDWNPALYSGAPLAADNQSGLFYPINLVVFSLWPALPYAALEWLVVLHVWLAGGVKHDLVVTLDDATSEIYSAFLVEQEGTASSFRGLQEVIDAHGLCCSLYTDRGSHYFYTPQGGGKVSKTIPTQFGRALQQLGIEHIAAYSPQARGRSERACWCWSVGGRRVAPLNDRRKR